MREKQFWKNYLPWKCISSPLGNNSGMDRKIYHPSHWELLLKESILKY